MKNSQVGYEAGQDGVAGECGVDAIAFAPRAAKRGDRPFFIPNLNFRFCAPGVWGKKDFGYFSPSLRCY